ncbi:quinone oxidoreductase family protein [Paractinoplanes globisporus]|uniref:Zinc-binding alcohol dehydrogenase family protein n=1 Tax=Paractinoplanes globisporus TaxID=113565 RepID=A0ABW6WVB8_9ACTN|nr:zinc-binding dehydrogenase [Actinoplanes globisporus]
MKAVQVIGFGDPASLALADLPDPTPGPGQLTIDVTHAAVGLVDVFFRQGVFSDRPGMPQPPFIPGLEVAGTVRELGDGVTGFRVGEKVVSMSGSGGTGGYASVYLALAPLVVSTEGYDLDPALAVSIVPNAAMAHIALTRVAHLTEGESVLVHGALGGFSAAFPGMARQLGASRVVGSVRSSKLNAASTTKLPYDKIVDSAELRDALGGEKFDVIVDPVGGEVRTQSLDLLAAGGRLLVVGNAGGDWTHQIGSNRLWLGSITVSGFNAGAYLPTHPQLVRPALEAALKAVAAGLGDTEVDVLPFAEAAIAHERMENRTVNGRIVLTPA